MDFLNEFLPVLMYILGIVLLIILIILGIRLIQILDRAEKVLDNIENKVNSLNGVFSLVGKATNSIAMISDSVIRTVTKTVSKIFKSKKKEEDYYE